MSAYTPTVTGTGPRAAVQRFGAFLAGMIMPNLGAFIAWGLITALTIQNGWINLIARAVHAVPATGTVAAADQISTLVGPIIVFLLPILIGYTGGRLVHGQRGAVVGAIATMGAVVAPVALHLAPAGLAAPKDITGLGPNFLAGFIMGPLTALILKLWDRVVDGKLASGFEMLVDNFSAGIIGGAMAVVGIYVLGPLIIAVNTGLGTVVDFLVKTGLLPLASIIVEPAKVLFLNNAIGNGVLVPLGAQQAHGGGTSILFMIESNPGPGLGILTAMMLFGPRAVRPTVPSAMVVHFLGGIHEIYFPYVLMKPILIIAAILGGAAGVATFVLLNGGLIAPASPGSIIAYILVSPPQKILVNIIGILVAAIVSFVVGSLLLGFGRNEKTAMDLDEANATNARNKGRKTAVAGA
ncbi:PTS mannitol transporter subunit IICB [Amnibacterium sp. CER49]|uniref:PTS mannitol transporter subunit IICB n=1 Tax=Amnibacterium sp. CER49 TaxID=3039161 RepID=UPI00244847BB|nr:PTS mannitol transporter subunit IICB [Amnibacterium sp. CER49]MDH2444392.1 PTS mannitol transporter subunit IICB [Amnibacterium sp. CER49]